MLSFSHTLVSLPFGIYFTNPFLIFAAAFVWHMFCDTLLHWNIFPLDFKRYPYVLVAADVIAGVTVAWLLLGKQVATTPIMAAIAGGNTPDVLHGLWDMISERTQRKYFAWARPFFYFHAKMQLETKSFGWGIISQVALIVISLTLILARSSIFSWGT